MGIIDKYNRPDLKNKMKFAMGQYTDEGTGRTKYHIWLECEDGNGEWLAFEPQQTPIGDLSFENVKSYAIQQRKSRQTFSTTSTITKTHEGIPGVRFILPLPETAVFGEGLLGTVTNLVKTGYDTM